MANNELRDQLQLLLMNGRIETAMATHFQPIVDMINGRILGFEALTRGPSDSALHSPLILFDVAAQADLLVPLERQLIRLIVHRFVAANLPGHLFINVSPDTLTASEGRAALLRDEFNALRLSPSRIVVELTEVRPIIEPEKLKGAVAALRDMGIVFALDDLGEGFASLKRWAEMTPDFVKIDRHFIDGVSQDPVKLEFVRSMLSLANSLGATIIAEGLEHEGDLKALQQLGVPHCQGFLLARPSANPRCDLRPEVLAMLGATEPSAVQRSARLGGTRVSTAETLARRTHIVTPSLSCREVVRLFRMDQDLMSIPVLDERSVPMGLLRRASVLAMASDRYFMDLFGKRSCERLMDHNPLCFDVATPITAMSDQVAGLRESLIPDGFIVTKQGAYFGSGTVTDLLKAITDLQVFCARYANPLTLLPGNVPIDQHIDHLLARSVAFVVAYFDIDHFKPFNDVYGYKQGDEVIKLCGRLIQENTNPETDFVGHIGGDDFVAVMQSDDWETRLKAITRKFDEAKLYLFDEGHRREGGYVTIDRRGDSVFQPLCTLSIGVVCADSGEFETHAQVATMAAKAKHEAKKLTGSALFIERRRYQHRLVDDVAQA